MDELKDETNAKEINEARFNVEKSATIAEEDNSVKEIEEKSTDKKLDEKNKIEENQKEKKSKRRDIINPDAKDKKRLRPLTLASAIMVIIASIPVLVGLGFLGYYCISLMLQNPIGSSLSGLFSPTAAAFSIGILPLFGVVVWILFYALYAIIAAALVWGVYIVIKNIIVLIKYSNSLDQAYMKNHKIVSTSINCVILAVVSFFAAGTLITGDYRFILKLSGYACIASIVLFLVSFVLILISLSQARKSFKANNAPEIYDEVLAEKKKNLRGNIFKRRRSKLKDFNNPRNKKNLY